MKNIQYSSLIITIGVMIVFVSFFSCEKGPSFREFDYPMPVVNDFYPKEGYTGSDVILEGSDFGDAIGPVKVFFGGVLVDTIRSVENGKIVVQVPENAISGDVSLKIW